MDEARDQLNNWRRRCEGLNDSIRLGLKRLQRDTSIEKDSLRTAHMVGFLRGADEILRSLDRALWDELDLLTSK